MHALLLSTPTCSGWSAASRRLPRLLGLPQLLQPRGSAGRGGACGTHGGRHWSSAARRKLVAGGRRAASEPGPGICGGQRGLGRVPPWGRWRPHPDAWRGGPVPDRASPPSCRAHTREEQRRYEGGAIFVQCAGWREKGPCAAVAGDGRGLGPGTSRAWRRNLPVGMDACRAACCSPYRRPRLLRLEVAAPVFLPAYGNVVPMRGGEFSRSQCSGNVPRPILPTP